MKLKKFDYKLPVEERRNKKIVASVLIVFLIVVIVSIANTFAYFNSTNEQNVIESEVGHFTRDTEPPKTFTPTVTAYDGTSITINGTTTDDISTTLTYEFFIGGVSKGTNITGTFQFTGLANDTSYSMYIVASDEAGNTRESTTISQKTKYLVYKWSKYNIGTIYRENYTGDSQCSLYGSGCNFSLYTSYLFDDIGGRFLGSGTNYSPLNLDIDSKPNTVIGKYAFGNNGSFMIRFKSGPQSMLPYGPTDCGMQAVTYNYVCENYTRVSNGTGKTTLVSSSIQSTNASAYPANGKHTDNYWYTSTGSSWVD